MILKDKQIITAHQVGRAPVCEFVSYIHREPILMRRMAQSPVDDLLHWPIITSEDGAVVLDVLRRVLRNKRDKPQTLSGFVAYLPGLAQAHYCPALLAQVSTIETNEANIEDAARS